MEAGVIHLLEASIKLKCNLEVTARSLLLYHHFRRCAAEIICDEDVIAAGALHLGARLYEQVIDLDSLICVFYSIVNQTTDVMVSDDAAYIILKNTLNGLDFMMLRVFEFDMNHQLAHQYLVPFLAMIFERSKNIADFHGELGRTCIRFLSDFYTQQICLEFSPELIAIACIDLSLHVHGLINDLTMIPAWYMGFICDITPDKVRVIKRIIMSLYEKPAAAVQAQQSFPTLEEQVTSSAEQATLAAQKGLTQGQFGQFAAMQQSLQAPVQQVLRPPIQQILQPPVQHVLQAPVQQVLRHPVQQGLQAPVQQGLQAPVQQGLRPPVQHVLRPPVQHVLQAPVQQVPGTDILSTTIQKLLSTPNLLPSFQGLSLSPRQQFLPTNLQHVESVDITDSSAQKS